MISINKAGLIGIIFITFLFGCKNNKSPVLVKLDNNLTIISKEIPDRNIATVLLAVKAGSVYENSKNNGISRLIEKILFNKSSKYNNIEKVIDSFGGKFFSSTKQDFTIFSATVRKEYIDKIIPIFADAIINPVINDSLINAEKEQLLSDLEKKERNPRYLLIRELLKQMYTVHPYRLLPMGTKKSINRIPVSEINNYFYSLYTPQNITFVIVGDINQKNVIKECTREFGQFQRKPVMKFSWKQEPEQNKPRRVILRSKTTRDVAVVSVGWHSPGIRNSDTYTMDIILQTLGLGISSRLNYQLTEEMSDVYWTGGNYITFREPGYFVLYAVCDPDAAEKVKNKILEEIDVLRRDSITSKELKKAKMYFIAGAAYDLESTLDYAYSLTFWSINKDLHFAETYLPNIKKVSLEDVKRVAKKYMPPNSYTSVILYPDKLKKR